VGRVRSWLASLAYDSRELYETEVIDTPWAPDDASVGPVLAAFMADILVCCRSFVRELSVLSEDGPSMTDEEVADTLRGVSPFRYGTLAEAKTLIYQFMPLYHNAMNVFFGGLNPSEVAAAQRARMLWGVGETATSRTELPAELAGTLARLGTLSKEQMALVARAIANLGSAVGDVLSVLDRAGGYEGDWAWIGLLEFQEALAGLVRSIVRAEALWAVWERTWSVG